MVKLYIELGKRTAATIRRLGYPTKNALKSWYREYARFRDLPRVNARHVKNVPGRKTDVGDAHWLATLARAGLLSA